MAVRIAVWSARSAALIMPLNIWDNASGKCRTRRIMPKAKPAAPALFADGELAEAPDNIVQSAYDAYNETAATLPWRQATVLTKARRATLKRAVQDYGGLAGFKAALARAAKSPFLLGHTGRSGVYKNWKPDIDFFCQPKSIGKLLDGVYDGDVEDLAPKKLFIPSAYQPPHLKPAAPFVPEPRDVRLAGMVATYRKRGWWDKANTIEQELANLEGRPAVLVPAPDVAHLSTPPTNGPRVQPAVDESKLGPSRRNERNYSDSIPPIVTDVDPGWDHIPEGAVHDDAD